jgi:hypothetical protein
MPASVSEAFQMAEKEAHRPNRIPELFMRNPAAWALAGLLAVALHGSYQRGKELDTVCEAIPWPEVTSTHPRNVLEAAQAICVNRKTSD